MQQSPTDAMRRRVVISSTIGNALEWFDFTVFGLFAATISKLFFPAGDPLASLLSTFAVFGLAFVARPLGGLVFGLYADRYGRKAALVAMITTMAIGTGLIGVLPTFASIGIAAPLLLLLARLIQGFSAGGEFGSASAMLIEFAPPGRKGFYGAFQTVSQALAFAIGAMLAVTLSKTLSPADFASWGWRVPFLLGILIGPVGWYLRRRCDESPEFQAYLAERAASTAPAKKTTLGQLFAEHPRELMASFGLIAAGTAIYYVGGVFLPAYAASELKLPLADAQLGLLAVSLSNIPLGLASGVLSDRIGRRGVIVPALLLYPFLYFMLFKQLVAEPSTAHLWQLQAVGLMLGVLGGAVPAFMTEIFPVGVRATGASLMYNLGVMLFGGLAPFVNTWMVQVTGDKSAPVYYIVVAATVGLLGMAVYRKTD
ncbi:putative Permease of the major facilitator superfamily (MFS); citrate transporter [Bradyrhizobium sp. ORS 375]|uniref:MFS transporter n=1 Tax=Bradyrhizobium sp. (strain ORS 375) TaxID=566679 RepID=UPI000240AD35|nr:MFS transporter [Bradyrhizobium sp. ORS 375]CCD92907.1 putative Permease of the major facilitator superfamily (MFS); citrate transporter [Bradyrhizobium sp. ORS 375]